MKLFNVEIKHDDTATASDAVALANAKTTADKEGKAIIFSGNNVFIYSASEGARTDLKKHWCMARSQQEFVKTVYITYSHDSILANINEAIDVCTALCDIEFGNNGMITVIVLKDAKFGSSNRTILPTVFSTSDYVSKVPAFVVGNASSGTGLIPSGYEKGIPSDCVSNTDGMII
jgi:hypothetical protein